MWGPSCRLESSSVITGRDPGTDQQLWAVMGELVLRAPRDPDLAAIFRQADHNWQRMLRELLTRCQAQGSLDPSLNADDMAALDGLDTGVRGGPEPDSITLEEYGRPIPEA